MSSPHVTICLPTLNSRAWLQERLDSIAGQTFTDWELLAYDSDSEDGTWEYLSARAVNDPRMRIWQGPHEGPYPAWNACVAEAKGEFIYIATSDDTMAPDCIERLLGALDRQRDCGLALCALVAIDEAGRKLSEPAWPDCSYFGRASGELKNVPHVHRAPFDGLLHCMGRIVYNSVTQLLIRRSVFDAIGYFPTQWGSVGDFCWEMKAGLVTDTVYVPDTWASWRVHPRQATAAVDLMSAEHAEKVEEMIQAAVDGCSSRLNPAILRGLRNHWLGWIRDMRVYYAHLWHRNRRIERRIYQAQQLFAGSPAARAEVIGSLLGRPKWPDVAADALGTWLESVTGGPAIVPEETCGQPAHSPRTA